MHPDEVDQRAENARNEQVAEELYNRNVNTGVGGAMTPMDYGGGKSVAYSRRPVDSTFQVDRHGNPKGGLTMGEGFHIDWQNGAFLEEVIEGCIERLEFFQSGKFACKENEYAIEHLRLAQREMQRRLNNRKERGVEGSYQP